MAKARQRYRIVFEALDVPVPAIHRLRRLLKHMLRGFGFKCLTVEEVRPGQPDERTDHDRCTAAAPRS